MNNFKFNMNGLEWEIIELEQKEIKEMMNKRRNNTEENVDSIDTRFFGVTLHDNLVIYLDKELPTQRKKKTLAHELAHCYIGCYITHQEKTFDEEMVADIVSNSRDMINEIIERYFGDNNENNV